MHRRFILAASFAVLAVPVWGGDDKAHVLQLSADQISTLLTGNTIAGTWSGSSYRQFFGEGGMTMYVPEGGRADPGRWRTNAETNAYESWWEQTGWTPYRVMMTNDGYAWVNGETLEPFEVMQGKQVNW